jgi:flagellar assembly factor FliW
MLRTSTKFLGEIDYSPDAVFSFPAGLPGFENHREFLFLNVPEIAPLMFLQCVSSRNLCFVLLPILTLEPDFRLELSPEEKDEIGLAEKVKPVIGKDVLCAAIITVGNKPVGNKPVGNKEVPFANLMAPVVVNLKTRTGIQVIHPEAGYSHRHPITVEELAVAC